MKSLNECIDFIINFGYDIPHSDFTLEEHLLGCFTLLKMARAPHHICLAGLFHSIYGNEYFTPPTPPNRELVKDYIGKEAEELVFLFCHLRDRDNTILKMNNKNLLFLCYANARDIQLKYGNNPELNVTVNLITEQLSIMKTEGH